MTNASFVSTKDLEQLEKRMKNKRNIRILLGAISLLLIVSACSVKVLLNETPVYAPLSIEEINFEPNSAGEKLLESISGSGDSICVLNYTYFDSRSSKIEESQTKEIIDVAVILNTYIELLISIEGHTEDSGSQEANQLLSEERARAVQDLLLSRGIETQRMRITGHGDRYPRVSNDNSLGKSKNRRVEIVIVE